MPNLWDHFSFGRSHDNHHKLQDGLFQIASQTCSILVKVNNTNNICYGNNSTNVRYEFPREENRDQDHMKILIPRTKKRSSFSGYKQRLSTVLENSNIGNASPADEELDQWEQSFMLRQDSGVKRWGTDTWCRPSCIPISFILILIILVVLVPLLEHTNAVANIILRQQHPPECSDQCRVSLVETIPEGMLYPTNATKHQDTQKTWLELIQSARNSIEIASFYWTLRENEEYPHPSSIKGEEVFQALYLAGVKRQISVKIVQSIPTKTNPNSDTETLLKKKAAQVRSVNFSKLLGGGVLHTKFWIVDRTHFYIGSANMDWRSLTQVKELGIVAYNCSCISQDIAKIFEVYWSLGKEDAVIPDEWPASLQTLYNADTPFNVSLGGHQFSTYISSSPAPLSPVGRTNDIDAIINVIRTAEKFVYISVMDYIPLTIYTPKHKFWPYIDDAIRAAALEEFVKVRMLIGWWNHSRPEEDFFLKSLTILSGSYPKVDIQAKRFVVPATAEQLKIPYARVNHNKYMVTDKTAYIGTSNWAGDYFEDTAGVAMVMEEPDFLSPNATEPGMRQQLQEVFERDWNSPYAVPLVRGYF